VPHKYLAQAQGAIKKHAQVKGESYNDEGAVFEVAFVPGALNSLLQEVEKITSGEAEIDIAGVGAAVRYFFTITDWQLELNGLIRLHPRRAKVRRRQPAEAERLNAANNGQRSCEWRFS